MTTKITFSKAYVDFSLSPVFSWGWNTTNDHFWPDWPNIQVAKDSDTIFTLTLFSIVLLSVVALFVTTTVFSKVMHSQQVTQHVWWYCCIIFHNYTCRKHLFSKRKGKVNKEKFFFHSSNSYHVLPNTHLKPTTTESQS